MVTDGLWKSCGIIIVRNAKRGKVVTSGSDKMSNRVISVLRRKIA